MMEALKVPTFESDEAAAAWVAENIDKAPVAALVEVCRRHGLPEEAIVAAESVGEQTGIEAPEPLSFEAWLALPKERPAGPIEGAGEPSAEAVADWAEPEEPDELDRLAELEAKVAELEAAK